MFYTSIALAIILTYLTFVIFTEMVSLIGNIFKGRSYTVNAVPICIFSVILPIEIWVLVELTTRTFLQQ